MDGLMQATSLTLPHFFHRAERFFWDKEIVTARPWGRDHTTYGEWSRRTRRVAGALSALGLASDARVGTLAWNTDRHLELYFAVPGTGRVLHTLNLRLYAEQLAYVIAHARDEAIFVDRSLAELLWPILPQLESVRHVVIMEDEREIEPLSAPPTSVAVHDYEELIATSEPAKLGASDEWAAASLCYTSGTTGNPKGVAYSHRSMYLHTLGVLAAGTLGVNEPDRVLPVVPMFHANAWGLAHAAVAAGSSLVLPGADLSPAAVASLLAEERVTLAAGVPTIWRGVLPELVDRDTSQLRLILGGGSAIPRALSEAYRRQIGIPITQAWGMTETSPVAAVCHVKSTLGASATDDELADLRTTIGVPVVGVDARIVGVDEPDRSDGTNASGELQVRGPWIASGYLADERSADSFTPDGWLRTGDVATMDAHGYLRIVDRTKDVIKSGGEWVSSVDLENELMAHPAVAEAAVIGVAHSKWQERPLACVVLRAQARVTEEELIDFLRPRVARWWLPDEIVFLAEIPKTSVGKFSKRDLRQQFAGHVLPTDRASESDKS